MMLNKNKEIAQEILISLVAKDKLDKITAYLNNNEKIKKQDLLDIINEEDSLFED